MEQKKGGGEWVVVGEQLQTNKCVLCVYIGARGGVQHTISELEMQRDKRSEVSVLQRLQLVAEPTLETKSKKINIRLDLQRLLSHTANAGTAALYRKCFTFDGKIFFLPDTDTEDGVNENPE